MELEATSSIFLALFKDPASVYPEIVGVPKTRSWKPGWPLCGGVAHAAITTQDERCSYGCRGTGL